MSDADKVKFNKAYDYAMFLLNLRLRTEGELSEKLAQKHHEPHIIEEVITELKSNNYVDDQRFAEVYLDNLVKYKYWGYFGAKRKMLQKKLPLDLVTTVLNAGLDESLELELGHKFLKKERLSLDTREDKAKAARKLAAKGFRSNVVSKLVFKDSFL